MRLSNRCFVASIPSAFVPLSLIFRCAPQLPQRLILSIPLYRSITDFFARKTAFLIRTFFCSAIATVAMWKLVSSISCVPSYFATNWRFAILWHRRRFTVIYCRNWKYPKRERFFFDKLWLQSARCGGDGARHSYKFSKHTSRKLIQFYFVASKAYRMRHGHAPTHFTSTRRDAQQILCLFSIIVKNIFTSFRFAIESDNIPLTGNGASEVIYARPDKLMVSSHFFDWILLTARIVRFFFSPPNARCFFAEWKIKFTDVHQ